MVERIPRRIGASKITDTTLEHGSLSDNVIYISSSAPTAGDDTYAVGTIWVDYTNGATYTCTVTSSENATWLNQDGDDVNLFQMQGNTGYVHGGTPSITNIYSFPFSAPSSTSDIAEVTSSHDYTSKGSMKDATHAYVTGGNPPAYSDVIQRWGFSAPQASGDIGELTSTRGYIANTTDKTNGQLYGGVTNPGASTDVIERFPLSASPSNSSDTSAELAANIQGAVGISDLTNSKGWACGGNTEPGTTRRDTIYQFANDVSSGTGTDWGNLQSSKAYLGGATDGTNGFTVGGESPGGGVNEIDKFPFSSPGNAADQGDLTITVHNNSGHASPTEIFSADGYSPSPGTRRDVIEKFTYASPGNSADTAELAQATSHHYGTENVG